MPKQSKITSSKPGKAAPVKERPNKFFCTRCTRAFTKQTSNFPKSQSPIYSENDGHLHVCRHCVEEMFQHYKDVLGDEKSALRRICMKFDYYWSDEVYDITLKASTSLTRTGAYISKANLHQYAGKTYDDTLDEEAAAAAKYEDAVQPVIPGQEIVDEPVVEQSIIDFWGSGLTPSFYVELERKYKSWCDSLGKTTDTMDAGEVAVIRQICVLETTINREIASGKSADKYINTLNSLLGSANLKPVQKKNDILDANTESTPFGVWIRKIENDRPISEPDPELRDVDGIIKYITVWFFGHLCKMLKLENKYSRLYEEEMARLRVDRPEYEGEDEEAIFEDIFSRATEGGGLNDK